EARDLITEVQDTIPEVKELLESTNENLGEGQDLLTSVLNEFPYVQDKVEETANRIRDVEEETDLNEVIELLKNDPDSEKGFFAQPLSRHKHEVFPIPNYGTGMTPFYTVLAVWVGGLLLISLLSTEIGDGTPVKPRHMYFGRLLTFITIGILQTLVITLGDVFILGVEVSSLLWFILFGILLSTVFM